MKVEMGLVGILEGDLGLRGQWFTFIEGNCFPKGRCDTRYAAFSTSIFYCGH